MKLELSVSKQTVKTKAQGNYVTDYVIRKDIATDTATLTDLFTKQLYSTNQWKDGKCKNSNFIRMTGITIDIDHNLPIADVRKLFEPFNYILHTSTSHKENILTKGGIQDRYRVILPFDPAAYDTINTPELAYAVYDKIMQQYDFVDKSCREPARKYFPFLNSQFPTFFELYINDTGTYFSVDVDEIEAQIAARTQAQPVVTAGGVDVNDIYRLTLDEVFLLKDKVTRRKLRDFKPKLRAPFTEPVFCNVCDDIHSQNDSAFVNFDPKGQPFVHCKHCQKTYKLNLLESYPHLFYLGNKLIRIHSQGIISMDECPSSHLNNLHPDIRNRLLYEIQDKRGFATDTFRINRLVDGYAETKRWELDSEEGQLNIYLPPVAVRIKDNDYIDNYLMQTFTKEYVDIIKLWMSVWAYKNYQTLPVLVFNGDRNTGKTTFGEMLQNIYPSLVQEWKAETENFTEYHEKKLLLVDEAEADRREQYVKIKAMTGADALTVNKKYMPKYRVQNNLNLILTTNNDSPLYVVSAEEPMGDFDNQFFMYRFSNNRKGLNAKIKHELADCIGWYVRTVCREIFERWESSEDRWKYRYGIPAPKTPMLMQQFNDSRSSLDYSCDEVYAACLEGMEVRDRQQNLITKLGPYDIVNSKELTDLVDAMKLKSHNIKSIRERMQSYGYLSRGIKLRKNNRDAWQVIPRDQLKKRTTDGTTTTNNGSSGHPEVSPE